MQNYFWSARFICGAISLLLAVSLLVGGLLAVRYTGADAWYYVGVGASLCAIGAVLALRPRIGLTGYALLLLAALAGSLVVVGLDIWGLMPHLLALVLWGGVLFALRHRIAPSLDPVEDPRRRLGILYHQARRYLREWR